MHSDIVLGEIIPVPAQENLRETYEIQNEPLLYSYACGTSLLWTPLGPHA